MSKNDDGEEEIRYSAMESIPIAIITFVMILTVFILEKVNQRPIRCRNAQITKWLMFGVIASNSSFQIVVLIEQFLCAQCRILSISWGCTRAIQKAINVMFLIHRAKLVQGITPVLSKKWFEKIFPSVIFVAFCGFMFGSINGPMGRQYACRPYDDWGSLSLCAAPKSEYDDGDTTLVSFAIGLDILFTAFLMMLFIIPLRRIYNTDLGVMNCNQLIQRKKLKHLLIWSIGLTFINQTTSTLLMVPYLNLGKFPIVLLLISQSDPAINVWTSWLMITRNRQYFKRLCCYRCVNSSTLISRSRSMTFGWTDRLSSTSNIERPPSLIDMISIDIATAAAVTEGTQQNPQMNSNL